MQSFTLRTLVVASLVVVLSFVGTLSARSDSSQLNRDSADRTEKRFSQQGVSPLSYRSPGANHKLVLPADDPQLEQKLLSSRAMRKLRKLGQYSVAEIGDAELDSLDSNTLGRARLRDDLNLVMLKLGQLDTTGQEPEISPELRQPSDNSKALHLVQLFGPPTPDSVETLTATGATIVGYIPNDTYLMWTTASQRRRLHALAQKSSSAVQWDGPYHPAYKLDPRIKLDSPAQVSVSIQVLDSATANNTIEFIKSKSDKVLVPESGVLGTLRIKILTESFNLKEIAKAPDVLSIERWSAMKLMDERADQIVAGALSFGTINNIQVSQPTAPGYLNFLSALGFNSNFDFSVDVGDTGFDVGSADASRVHPDFLDSSGASRVAYLHDFTNDFHSSDPTILPTHDALGHGTINASIIGGFNNKADSAHVDSQGFDYGLGIAPFARVGASKLFPDSASSAVFSYTDFISAAYRSGARVSNNSWGSSCGDGFCNLYSDDTREFDGLVRDADPTTPGNQSMTIVFAAGNDGDTNAPSVSVPGTAKNVIAVGLSENVRGIQTDGCGVTVRDADNAQDVVYFSGFGPVQDGRAKPDLVAPGSHMEGAASQDKIFANTPAANLGVCDRYFPPGQTLYTWSSGTSHSTPVVTGAAALAYQWLRTRNGSEPSPALVKALLLNSTSYLNGAFGGDSLPGAHQGWGLLDIGRMFEPSSRILYDESPDRTFTQSGGAPFETTAVVADATKEFRAMLVWSDAPGSAVTNAPYVNQLNLEVVVGGVVYSGNNFQGQYSKAGGQTDFLNNVQGVRLPAGTTGPILIRVRPTVIAGDGVPGNDSLLDQDFALVVTNANETAVPILAIDTVGDVSARTTVQHSNGSIDASLIPGETARITLSLTNKSQAASASVQAASLSLSSNQGSSTFSAIGPGQAISNTTPFQIQVPSDLRCGSVASLQLQVDTNAGRFTLPVRIQVGRPSTPGAPAQTLLFDDVDNSTVKWKSKGGFGPISGTAKSGTMSFHTEDPGKTKNDSLLSQLFTKKGVVIPANAGQARLSFFHIFNFEPGYDGGVLEISADGSDWQDAGTFILVGGYDGKVPSASNNPLGNRLAWTARGTPGVFSQVIVDLSSFAGKRVSFRFLAGFDNATGVLDGYRGWFIDDVQVTAVLYSCAP